MSRRVVLTAVIEREDDVYVASCPELSIASHGETIDEARRNLIEALEGWFETASAAEIAGFEQVRQKGSHLMLQRRSSESTVTVPVPMHRGQMPLGTLRSVIEKSRLPSN